MKKTLSHVLISLICISVLTGCSGNITSEDPTTSDISTYSENLTDSQIEALVVSALYSKLSETYDTVDAGSCRYSINKTETTSSGFTYVYGSVTLYDKYGKLTTGWIDGSGTAFRDFTVGINNSYGTVSSCKIN